MYTNHTHKIIIHNTVSQCGIHTLTKYKVNKQTLLYKQNTMFS